MEAHVFGTSIHSGTAAPSFLYLMIAATYFRHASHTRHPQVRGASRDLGHEYLTNTYRVGSALACPASGPRPLKSNT
jgi:hypothetical protein